MAITYKKISELSTASTINNTTDLMPISVWNGSSYTTEKLNLSKISSNIGGSNWDSVYSTVNSNSATWASGGGTTYTAASPLVLNGTTFGISSKSINYSHIADGSITYDQLSLTSYNLNPINGYTGLGRIEDSSHSIKVNVDNSTISINSGNNLYVKDGGITNAQLANSTIGASKIKQLSTGTALSVDAGLNDALAVQVDNSTIKINPSNQLYATHWPTSSYIYIDNDPTTIDLKCENLSADLMYIRIPGGSTATLTATIASDYNTNYSLIKPGTTISVLYTGYSLTQNFTLKLGGYSQFQLNANNGAVYNTLKACSEGAWVHDNMTVAFRFNGYNEYISKVSWTLVSQTGTFSEYFI